MKRRFVQSAVIMGAFILSAPAFATTPTRDDAMQRCFREHARLMDKPAVETVHACWRAHGYLMHPRPRRQRDSPARGNRYRVDRRWFSSAHKKGPSFEGPSRSRVIPARRLTS